MLDLPKLLGASRKCNKSALAAGRKSRTWNSSRVSNAVSASRFRRYVRELHALTADAARPADCPWSKSTTHAHLNGRASNSARPSQYSELRRIGAFFTGSELGTKVAALAGNPAGWRIAVDPACGCGDLLLAAAWRLPVDPELTTTLRRWGRVLHGVEVVPEFVDVARHRLMLLALLRGARVGANAPPDLRTLLPGLVTGDGRHRAFLSRADVVLLNPPYGQAIAPDRVRWASGLVTEAAVWIDDTLRPLRPAQPWWRSFLTFCGPVAAMHPGAKQLRRSATWRRSKAWVNSMR